MIRAIARLVDRERAPIQRFGLGVSGLRFEQQPEFIHQSRRRVRNASFAGTPGQSQRMRRERVERRPALHVLWIAYESHDDPPQSFLQNLPVFCSLQPSLRKILYQTMDGKTRL